MSTLKHEMRETAKEVTPKSRSIRSIPIHCHTHQSDILVQFLLEVSSGDYFSKKDVSNLSEMGIITK
jgi:hypothetical protein